MLAPTLHRMYTIWNGGYVNHPFAIGALSCSSIVPPLHAWPLAEMGLNGKARKSTNGYSCCPKETSASKGILALNTVAREDAMVRGLKQLLWMPCLRTDPCRRAVAQWQSTRLACTKFLPDSGPGISKWKAM